MDGYTVMYFDVGRRIMNDTRIKKFEVSIWSNLYASFGKEIVSKIVIMHEQYSCTYGSQKRENLLFWKGFSIMFSLEDELG